MRLTQKGQITIPIDIREQLDLRPGDEVVFGIKDGEVRIKKAAGSRSRGQRVINRLRGRADVPMTTSQIMALTREG